ncbi:MAG: DUF1045 domain-containing protein, partial [Candidatus Liptonbacteria bacterium]|nr:DUF1045 domain-containing protein [Candidatus Liptonbacteria bacterium]
MKGLFRRKEKGFIKRAKEIFHTMQSKSFNIVIYPPKEISQKAITVSKELKKKGGLFFLDGKNYFPHVTIYMTEFPVKNIPKVKKVLRNFAAKTKPFHATSLKYRQSADGYIDVDYRKSKEIKDLQKKVIALLNPLREGLSRPKDEARISELSKAQQRNIKRYGYRGVGAEFFPHIT